MGVIFPCRAKVMPDMKSSRRRALSVGMPLIVITREC